MLRSILFAFACLFACLAPAAPAQAASQIALVIGNTRYATLDELPLAATNAVQVSEALGAVGFRSDEGQDGVRQRNDLDLAGMAAEIRAFDQKLAASPQGSVGFLYFSGHGLARERRGDVYLLPTDATVRAGVDLDQVGIPLADMLQLFRSHRGRTVIVVIDACRNVAMTGPTTVAAPHDQGSATRDAGAGWGLQTGGVGLLQRGVSRDFGVTTREGADYFVAFSTSPDRVAYDTDIFSSVMADEIKKGRADVLTLFKRVGERVAQETRRQGELQLPTYEVGIYRTPPCFGRCAVQPDPGRFYDCPGCPWMRVIQPGTFWRGAPADETGRDSDEPAPTETRVERPFAIGVYEVTRAEWRACEKAGACRTLSDRNTWQTMKAPVAGITLEDSQAFVKWLSQMSGARYRLPTEIEWEYAARAGARTPFAFGDAIAPAAAAYDYSASYRGSQRAEYRGAPEAVGSFEPNEFGLFDVHGNIWEWACAEADPACAAAILRGGSYKSAPGDLRAANRFAIRPTDRREDVGLRVLREL